MDATTESVSLVRDATEYELLRLLENSRDSRVLSAALRERDERLRSRHHARDFWQDVFYQETRKLRDNIGGDYVRIPPGSYLVGDYLHVHQRVRRVHLKKAFAIGRFPVTEGAFSRFVEDDGYAQQDLWSREGWGWRERMALSSPWLWTRYPYDPQRARLPMAGITYFEAEAYCAWSNLGGEGHRLRLASSQEWEIAARGRLGRLYPWGCHQDGARCNVATAGFQARTPVNRYPGGISPLGCWDMLGNVGELTSDLHAEHPRIRSLQRRVLELEKERPSPFGQPTWFKYLLPVRLRMRGGSYQRDWEAARLPGALFIRPDKRVNDLGFRVVQETDA